MIAKAKPSEVDPFIKAKILDMRRKGFSLRRTAAILNLSLGCVRHHMYPRDRSSTRAQSVKERVASVEFKSARTCSDETIRRLLANDESPESTAEIWEVIKQFRAGKERAPEPVEMQQVYSCKRTTGRSILYSP